jgi:hypothetical protein
MVMVSGERLILAAIAGVPTKAIRAPAARTCLFFMATIPSLSPFDVR